MGDETAAHVLLEFDALSGCRLRTLDHAGSDMENIRRDPIRAIRALMQRLSVLQNGVLESCCTQDNLLLYADECGDALGIRSGN